MPPFEEYNKKNHKDEYDAAFYIFKYFGDITSNLADKPSKPQIAISDYHMINQMRDALEIEHQERDMSKEDRIQLLQIQIDDALDSGNKELFMELTSEYNELRAC